jgi:hypothetical protein
MTVYCKVHSSIRINLIRDVNKNTKDDIITIRRTNVEGVVHLRYQDSVTKSKHELRLTDNEVCQYFISLFHAMSYDTEPFHSVQVNFPAFPCILLSTKDLEYDSLRLRLQSMIHFTLKTSFVKMDDDDEDLPPLESGGGCDCGHVCD